MRDEKYNGWANYETWLVKLWLDNEPVTDKMVYSLLENFDFRRWKETEYTYDVIELARMLQEWHEGKLPRTIGVFNDLLTGALAEVHWREIAESYIRNYAYEKPLDPKQEYQFALTCAEQYFNFKIQGNESQAYLFMQQVDRYLPD